MKRIGVLALFVLLTFIITWPLILHLNGLIWDKHDGLLITWFLNWDIHCLTGGLKTLQNCYNANIFFPYKNTLAFSETMFPEAMLALPFVLLTKEPLVAYNFNFLLGFILTGFSIFVLAENIFKKFRLAIFLGILFSFSTIHLNYMAHLQLFNFWSVILSINYLITRRYKLFVLFFVIVSLTTALNLYFLLFTSGLFWILYPSERKSVFIATLVSGILASPFLIPLYLVSRQFNYVRPTTDAINFSLQFPQLLNISVLSRLSGIIPPTSHGTPAYFGGVFLVLFVLLVIKVATKKLKFDTYDRKLLLFFVGIAIISFVFSLGPALHLQENTVHIGPFKAIPLPYAVFYYLLPGFAGLRTPSRWIILTAFSVCILIGFVFNKKINNVFAIGLILLVIFEINLPLKYFEVRNINNFPPEQVWLKHNYKDSSIIQFPIYNWSDQPGFGLETLREYYSTIHWRPMFNGYSGFSPIEWEKQVAWLQREFPSTETLKFLKGKGIVLILAPASSQEKISPFKELVLVERFPDTIIYKLQ